MDDTTILGGVLSQLGQTAKKTVQQVVNLPEETSKEEEHQVAKKSDWKSDEERVNFLKGLYGSAQPSPEALADKAEQAKKTSANPLTNSTKNKKPSEFQERIADKPPEEQKKLLELRQQLHKQVYYDPTFNPVKKQEERPAEKVENEKKKEMIDLQKKEEEKPQPLAVVREQNKAEMFRGASG